MHWADEYATDIINRFQNKEKYVVASGITPSGVVHVGNFRELISVDLVKRALVRQGKEVRFIFSWDDYDVFRKVPVNMPEPELLSRFLGYPLTQVPDTTHLTDNYAQHNEKLVEDILPVVGIFPEYIYQHKQYQSAVYSEQIRLALEKKEILKDIVNEIKTEKIQEEFWPISIFSRLSNTNKTQILSWDGEYTLRYRDSLLQKEDEIDFRIHPCVKLLWRFDWPMRWAYEKVDFEPAGKDHHSPGGSFDTAKKVVPLFSGYVPSTFKYDFVRIKGLGGKMSSSSGEVLSLSDVLKVYTPQLVRYLFVSSRPNRELAISFDLDILQYYESYAQLERIYFGKEIVPEEKKARYLRIYELSQINQVPSSFPSQVNIRQLLNILQIYEGDIDKSLKHLGLDVCDLLLQEKAKCLWHWLSHFAPERFLFTIHTQFTHVHLQEEELKLIQEFNRYMQEREWTEDNLAQAFWFLKTNNKVELKSIFRLFYHILLKQSYGPRLAEFFMILGRSRIESALNSVLNAQK